MDIVPGEYDARLGSQSKMQEETFIFLSALRFADWAIPLCETPEWLRGLSG